jgi:predicted nuclease of predicted toxin-antitoxin system
MRIRFQADADLDGRILRGLRRVAPEVDVRTASEAGLAALDDSEVLHLAAEAGRVLISQDRSTMPRHFQRFVSRSQSPGVILLRARIPIAVAIEELFLIWAASETEEWINRLAWIPL